MTKMKKLFAVVLALAMLFTMASFSASADEATEAATITMTATGDVVTKEISVVINASDNVGGLTATLAYDKSSAQVVKGSDNETIIIADADASNQGLDTVKDNKDGTLSIVLLGQNLTIKFKALVTDEKSTFTLSNIKASNTDGTATLTVPENVTAEVELNTVIAEGNTIRKTTKVENQDLGFVSTFIGAAVPEGATDVKLGFVAIPKAMLAQGELVTLETQSRLNAEVKVDRDVIAAEASTKFVAHIAGIVNNESRMGRVISGRFYVSYKVGDKTTIAYSNNTNTDQNVGPIVNEGVVSKSFVGTCKAMASAIISTGLCEGDTSTIEKIIGLSTTDNDQKKALLEFVVYYADILEQLAIDAH